jgi:hypothetical protein
MSNGLLDPSLAGLNAGSTNHSPFPGKAAPSAALANAPATNNASIPLKKNADKEKGQPDKDESSTTVPAIPGQNLPLVPVIVQAPIQVAPNNHAGKVDSSGDDKISKASDASVALDAALPEALQVNSSDKKPGPKPGQQNAGPVKKEGLTADDQAISDVDTDSSGKASQTNTSQANTLAANEQSAIKAITKSAIDAARPALKHSETTNNQQTKPAPDPSPELVSGSVTNSPANNNPSDNAANAVVLNAAASNPSADNNQPADTKRLTDKNNVDATTQASNSTDDKSKDSAVTVKAPQHKDEGQLSQQDGQQAPVQNYDEQQANAAGNSAFHAAVAQQMHATPTANGVDQHPQLKVQTSAHGNSLQSDLRVNMGPVHDSALPVSSGPLQSAKLVERLGQSELRVGVQMGDMGGVDIRTSMAHNQLTAEISVEHSELGHMLAANLPSLQNRLSEHQIQTANIVFQNQTNSGFSGSEQRSRQENPQPAVPIERIPYSVTESVSRASVSAVEPGEMIAGLDIHI